MKKSAFQSFLLILYLNVYLIIIFNNLKFYILQYILLSYFERVK